MTDENTTEETEVADTLSETPATAANAAPEGPDPESDPDMFPRQVVEDLRKENGKYRQRAQLADTYATRLHTEMVKATGRLADPTDLPFDETHLDDADSLNAAIDQLLEAKPHLATRRPTGDIGQGNRGGTAQPFNLLQALKERV
ncbi:hypothetical protein AB4Z39_12815 [Mycobacterium adipatum]|uniref:hypothetical protein n=1 Tax=Mycobacterium adipatum TaxID=1682113 RepID=UPI0034E0AA79